MYESVGLHVLLPLEIEVALVARDPLHRTLTLLQVDPHRDAITTEFATLPGKKILEASFSIAVASIIPQ